MYMKGWTAFLSVLITTITFITKRCYPDKVNVQGTGAALGVSDEPGGYCLASRVRLAGQNFDRNPHPSSQSIQSAFAQTGITSAK
jgi:hypothetical protein